MTAQEIIINILEPKADEPGSTDIRAAIVRIRKMADALRQFEECDFNESHCGSMHEANGRIRNIARRALYQ